MRRSGGGEAPRGHDRDVQEREGPDGNADYASRGEDAGTVARVQQVQLQALPGLVQGVWNAHHECEEEHGQGEVHVQQGTDDLPPAGADRPEVHARSWRYVVVLVIVRLFVIDTLCEGWGFAMGSGNAIMISHFLTDL